MGNLPSAVSLAAAIGSQLNQTYQFYNDDGTLMDITNKTFEFVIRTDPSQTGITVPVVSVNSTSSTASGFITVTTSTSTLLVTVSASAMASLSQQMYVYTLWMDQNLADATALVNGSLFAGLVASQF